MEVLSKAAGREHLVLSEVQVNSKHGTYRSHRWVNPTEAMDSIKKELKAKGDIEFVGKDGKAYSEKQIVEKHSKEAPTKTIQQYVKENFRIRRATYETLGDLKTRKPLTSKENKNTTVETINNEKIKVAVLKGEEKSEGNKEPLSDEEVENKFIETLEGMGANRWTKYDRDRLYLQKILPEMIGLKISRYNTGNISDASINGEKISNSSAGRYLAGMEKTYYDIKNKKLFVDTHRDEVVEDITKAMDKLREDIKAGTDTTENKEVTRAKEIRSQYIDTLTTLKKEFDKNKDKMKSKDRLQASSIIQFVGDIIQRQDNPSYWNGLGEITKDGIDLQKMNDMLVLFPDSKEKIEPFDVDTLKGTWDENRIKIAESQNKVLKENYRLKATNDYKEVKSGEEFIKAAKNLDKLPVDRFARAMLDSTNVKCDLIMASYLPGALGAVSSSGDKNKYVALLDTEEYTERARKKTAVHENMHALLTKLIKRSTKEHTETFEEPIVEMAALYSQRELANSNSYVTTPSYADRIAHIVPVLVDMPEFRKCNNVTDLGKVLLNGVLKKDKKLLNKIDNSVVRYDKGRETAIKNFESYLPKDKASRDKFLDKHKDITVKDRNNTLNKKDKNFEVGMSSLISALKSGSLNIEQAFNDPGKKSLMYVLLLSFMEEEGIDGLSEYIPF